MKRFAWRLQRLLDIRQKQEDMLRLQLVAITEKIAAIRTQIMLQKATTRKTLTHIGQKKPHDRLSCQQLFLKFMHVSEQAVKKLEESMAKEEKLRNEKMKEMAEIRKSTKTLQKVRDNARADFTRQQDRLEQKTDDDRTSLTYARKIVLDK